MEDSCKEVRNLRPGIILVFLFLAALSNGIAQYRLNPIVVDLIGYWGIGESLIGTLASSTTWLATALCIPLGFLAKRIKPRWSIFITFVFLLVGDVLGLMAGSFTVLIVARLIEGVGIMEILIIAFSLVANLFPDKGRVLATSVITIGALLGQVINLQVYQYLDGWQGMYRFILILHVVFCIACLIGISGKVEIQGSVETQKPTREQTLRVYKTPSLWLVSLAEGCFYLGVVILGTYIPTYLVLRGIELDRANSLYALSSSIGIVAVIGFSLVADKLKSKRTVAMICFFSTLIPMFLVTKLPIHLILIYIVLLGICPRGISPTGNAAMPDCVDNVIDVPIASSLKEMVGKVFLIVGSIVIGVMLQFLGYEVTIYALMALMAFGGFCWM